MSDSAPPNTARRQLLAAALSAGAAAPSMTGLDATAAPASVTTDKLTASLVNAGLARLAAPSGSLLVGHAAPGATEISTSVGTFLNNIHGIDVTLHGASPSASAAANTVALNRANAAAIASGRPVYFPPIGSYKIGRLAPVAGSLVWYSDDKGGAAIQVDTAAWPYDASNAAVLDVTGSFRTHGLTWDQNWVTSARANVGGHYIDHMNPATWGGFWFVRVLCSTSDVLEIKQCGFKNMARGFFAQAADTALGGAASVVMTDCSANNLDTAAQSILAAEAPQSLQVADCWSLVTKQWDKGAVYSGNGTSVVFAWGGADIQIIDSRFVGYQLVARGPSSIAWSASNHYFVGLEYSHGAESYRVVRDYRSGVGFGAVDLANVVRVFNPMRKIQVCRNVIVSPIADTAVYGWEEAIIDENFITNSGDMGIAASGTRYLSVSNNFIDGVRNGGIDVTYGGVANVGGNVVKDYARGSAGVYRRIDSINPSVWASNGGFNLAGITVGLIQEPGTKQVNIYCNNLYFVTLPPLTDGGPNNGGIVRAAVNGIYSQNSSNHKAQNTINATGNTLQDRQADMPQFYLAVATLRFYNLSFSGTLRSGDVFSDGAVRFILVDLLAAGGFTFVRQFQGAAGPFGGQVFTGTNGATITVAANPQVAFINASESGNIDYTTRLIGAAPQDVLRSVALYKPGQVRPASQISFTIAVGGAVRGDYAQVAAPYGLAGMTVHASVDDPGSVAVIVRNDTAVAVDLPQGLWRAKVSKG